LTPPKGVTSTLPALTSALADRGSRNSEAISTGAIFFMIEFSENLFFIYNLLVSLVYAGITFCFLLSPIKRRQTEFIHAQPVSPLLPFIHCGYLKHAYWQPAGALA
jgi:hypothetical protein